MGGGGGHRGFLLLDALSGALDRFDVIIGTIPAPVLTEPLLALVRKDALLLELASAPGGIDAAAAHERGLRYIRAPGLPAKYAPERAAVILRDAVYAAAAESLPRLGLAVTGSHCTFSRALEAFRPLKRDYTLVPILSGAAAGTDTRFFAVSAFRAELEAFCGREAVDNRPAEIRSAPRSGSTRCSSRRARAARSQSLPAASRTPPSQWRARRICETARRSFSPFPQTTVSGSAESIAALLQRKNVYFVPFRQDAPHQKPFSLQSDFDLPANNKAAMEGRRPAGAVNAAPPEKQGAHLSLLKSLQSLRPQAQIESFIYFSGDSVGAVYLSARKRERSECAAASCSLFKREPNAVGLQLESFVKKYLFDKLSGGSLGSL